jgi:hypothetical protein
MALQVVWGLVVVMQQPLPLLPVQLPEAVPGTLAPVLAVAVVQLVALPLPVVPARRH